MQQIPSDQRDVQRPLVHRDPERDTFDLPTGHLREVRVHDGDVAARLDRPEAAAGSTDLLPGPLDCKAEVASLARLQKTAGRTRVEYGVERPGPAS